MANPAESNFNIAEDGWDWPWIIFIGMKELGWTEQQIRRTTPRHYFALINCAITYNNLKYGQAKTQEKPKLAYIDQISL